MPSSRLLPTYQATLYSLWKIEKPGIQLGLEAMQKLSQHLGNPWKDFPCILIAGTNGKGSTAATLSEILFRAGYKVGLYSSPHLKSYRERIVMKDPKQGIFFSEELWSSCFVKLYDAIQDLGMRFTQFEILTALAFLIFQKANVDVAVLEVGMGGRLDATNVVSPILSMITTIDLDHQEYLGNTLTNIAREKAGIFHEKGLAVTISQNPEVLQTLQEEAEKKKADFKVAAPGNLLDISLDLQTFEYEGNLYQQSLIGPHQVDNASLCLEGIKILKSLGFCILDEHVKEGLRKVVWPGRFEMLARSPLVLADGAHNPNGCKALMETLKRVSCPKPHSLILGILESKDAKRMLQILKPFGDEWILTSSMHPKAIPSESLLALAKSVVPEKPMRVSGRVGEALRIALSGKGTVLITGSLFTVGEGRRLAKGLKTRRPFS